MRTKEQQCQGRVFETCLMVHASFLSTPGLCAHPSPCETFGPSDAV